MMRSARSVRTAVLRWTARAAAHTILTGWTAFVIVVAVLVVGRLLYADRPKVQEGHQVFASGRSRLLVGDDSTEVEVFKDQDGVWVAMIWERGRCWCGKLTERKR